MVYDRTCVTKGGGLSTAWFVGSRLYERLDWIDASFGATSWAEALAWLGTHESISEVQYWGHGRWGRVYIDDDRLDATAFDEGHSLYSAILKLKSRLTPDALVWLRTCEAFGADAGHHFASRMADTLGARVAGHTFIIGAAQSGLRTLLPGQKPDWSPTEGLREGTAADPKRALNSWPWLPRTVSCLRHEIPPGW